MQRASEKNPAPLHNKCPEETRDTRNISQYNRHNLQQAHGQLGEKLNGEKLKAFY